MPECLVMGETRRGDGIALQAALGFLTAAVWQHHTEVVRIPQLVASISDEK